MNWETVRLSDCCISISDGDHQPPPKAVSGVPFVTIANINKSNQFDFSDTMFVSKEYYDRLDSKRKAQTGDILYSVVGSFGIPVLIKEEKPFVFQRHIAILRPNEKINPSFLYYTMLGRDFYAKADAAAIGAAQRTISLTSLRGIKIALPPLDIQEAIASKLSAYDNLIENNQKQIKLLEEAAQRLYKEWFVDLRFPGYEDTPIVDGVPEGWTIKTLKDIAPLKYGKALKNEDRIPGQFPVYGSSGIIGTHVKSLVSGPTIIIGRKGNIGSVFWSPNDCHPIDTVYYIDTKYCSFFLYNTLQQINFINTDSAVPGLNRDFAHSCLMLIADHKVFSLFEKIVSPCYQQIEILERHNSALSKARDLLLPKLMNGEIDLGV